MTANRVGGSGDGGLAEEVVDAHLHLWDLATGDYTWNTPALGPVHASFGPHDAAAALGSAGVDRAVLVQAADTVQDSERMFAAAADHPWVAGVVAWVPLDDPARARSLLERWSATGRLCGIRQLLHDDPDPDVLDRPDVRSTLSMVAARGLPLDVPDAWPRLWPATLRLVDEMPELTVVLDHLGKPRLDLGAASSTQGDDLGRWQRDLVALAARGSVVAKLSGLGSAVAAGVVPDAPAVAPLVEAALGAFGPDRLMFGGDWPVSLGHGSYADAVATARDALEGLSAGEQSAVFGGTARRVYLGHDSPG